MRASLIIGFVFVFSPSTFAQEEKSFATKGVWELGGSAAYINSTQVTNGNTGSTINAFLLSPYVGVFLTDGFEIGINPLGYSTTSSSLGSTTSINTFIAPSYNFKTKTSFFPFIEADGGYNHGELRFPKRNYGAKDYTQPFLFSKAWTNYWIDRQ